MPTPLSFQIEGPSAKGQNLDLMEIWQTRSIKHDWPASSTSLSQKPCHDLLKCSTMQMMNQMHESVHFCAHTLMHTQAHEN